VLRPALNLVGRPRCRIGRFRGREEAPRPDDTKARGRVVDRPPSAGSPQRILRPADAPGELEVDERAHHWREDLVRRQGPVALHREVAAREARPRPSCRTIPGSRLPAPTSDACTATIRTCSPGVARDSTKTVVPSVHVRSRAPATATSSVRPAIADASSRTVRRPPWQPTRPPRPGSNHDPNICSTRQWGPRPASRGNEDLPPVLIASSCAGRTTLPRDSSVPDVTCRTSLAL
jgi:hypothetical protein